MDDEGIPAARGRHWRRSLLNPPATQPLLTIAVPTYKRAPFLREFFEVLGPQWIAMEAVRPGAVELLVSDNASPDDTAAVLDEAERAGVRMRRLRQVENIGSDRNFVVCFEQARGRYFWLCGDDDVLRPGAVATVVEAIAEADYDWIFLPPEPFVNDWQTEFKPDPHGRGAQVVRSARQMVLYVNVMITFITCMVIHRERLLALRAEPPAAFVGTNLTQLSWTLPLLRTHTQSLILWQRLVAGRRENSGGYSVGNVFGEQFVGVARRLLPAHRRLANSFLNVALRQWFPSTLLELRTSARGDDFSMEEAEGQLRGTFRRNFRFWLFTWPVLRLPLPAARAWARGADVTSRVLRALRLPAETAYKLQSRRRRELPPSR